MNPAREAFDPHPGRPRLRPDVPLPPYRYVPGRGPHPIKHKDGHTFGRQEVLAEPGTEGFTAVHERAMDLFHHGFYWEAHEAWESLWHRVQRGTPESWLLQALIQAAALQLKHWQGLPDAAQRLSESVKALLAQAREVVGDACLGLDLPALERTLPSEHHPILTAR